MQPIRVLQTIQWIRKQVSPGLEQLFFSNRLLARRVESSPAKDANSQAFEVAHEMVRISTLIELNPDAVKVIRAFGLERILSRDYLLKFARTTSLSGGTAAMNEEHLVGVIRPWQAMTGSEKAWKILTTPNELLADVLPKDVFSVEIQSTEENVPLQSLLNAIRSLQTSYAAISAIYFQGKGEAKLDVLSIQSGSPNIRIDCKGIAEAIKALKDFFHETWNKIKYRRVEELIQNNSAVLSTIQVIQEIERKTLSGAIAPEQGEQFKRALISSAISLFEAGGLPTDIVRTPPQQDSRLLKSFTPKLLPASVEQKKAKSKKKHAGRSRKPHEQASEENDVVGNPNLRKIREIKTEDDERIGDGEEQQ